MFRDQKDINTNASVSYLLVDVGYYSLSGPPTSGTTKGYIHTLHLYLTKSQMLLDWKTTILIIF